MAEAKGWGEEQAQQQLAANFRAFYADSLALMEAGE